MAYRVTVRRVQAKDMAGHLRDFHHGDVIAWLNDDQRRRFLRLKHVEEVAGKHEAPDATPAQTVDDASAAVDIDGDVAAGGRPRQVAPKEAWVDYGASLGNDRALLESMTKADLIAQLG